jgi:hypothetical protein
MKNLIKGYGREKRLGYIGIDNRLIDDGKVVNPMHRPHSTLQKHYFVLLVLIYVRG